MVEIEDTATEPINCPSTLKVGIPRLRLSGSGQTFVGTLVVEIQCLTDYLDVEGGLKSSILF